MRWLALALLLGSAAPTFSVNDGAYVFSGAQETARWKLILEHFAADDDA